MKANAYAPILTSCLFLLSASAWGACDGASAVKIERTPDNYYKVRMDYAGCTHKEMGTALAREIARVMPDYEVVADSLLEDQFALLKKAGVPPDFSEALKRSRAIARNVDQDYLDEIAGMSEVFSTETNALGDGKLSKDEFLVLQMFQDVLRPTQCSAAAAFGESSASGSTIIGRNLDWDALPRNDTSKLHAVSTIVDGAKTMTWVHFLGLITPNTAVTSDRLFAALLDAETGEPYPEDLSATRSYPFDLRRALETQTSLSGLVETLTKRKYAFNHLVFVGDKDTAGVIEQSMAGAARGLRTARSPLREGLEWGVPDAVATVNDNGLPGNPVMDDEGDSNAMRWASYRSLMKAHLARGKIDVPAMRGIVGFSGTTGHAGSSGALFLSNRIVTVHSIVARMDTLEMWASFTPKGTGLMPLNPNYVRIAP